MSVAIRRMCQADAPAVQRLSRELGYEVTADALTLRLARLLCSEEERVLVAEDGALVGWAHASVTWSLEAAPCVELRALVVSATARRRGVGRALVEAVDAWRVERALGVLRVRSNVARTEAHHFYPHLGFTVSKTQHVYVRS